MGEHTDFGIVTVLWADQVAGLQVLGSDGSWHDVSPADGALLVNLGDLTARLDQRTLAVDPAPGQATDRRRHHPAPASAAYFHDGNADAVIATLPSPASRPARTNLYAPITVGEHIAAKLAGSRAGELNAAAAARGRPGAGRSGLRPGGGLFADAAVEQLTDHVELTDVAGVLLEHVQQDPAQRGPRVVVVKCPTRTWSGLQVLAGAI